MPKYVVPALSEAVICSGDDLNAAGRQRRDMLRDAAEQDPSQAAAPAFAKRNQVHSFAFRDVQNECRGITEAGNRLNRGHSDES
jgi:hypothetical protein